MAAIVIPHAGGGEIVEQKRGSPVCAVLALVVLSGALSLATGFLPPSPVSRGSMAAADLPPDVIPQAYLPYVVRPPTPEEPPLTIYDLDGTERDWDWLIATFGAVTLERGTGTASVTVLRTVEGPVAMVIRTVNSVGDPIENVPIVFHWPDAPPLEPWQQACGLDRGIIGYTDGNGYTDFILGSGAYYFPPNGGPHTVWVAAEGTDCLGGLGMLGGTNHKHLDSEWTLP
jgi:hypothetical protein